MHNCPPSVSCLDCLLRDTHFFAHFSQTTHNVFFTQKNGRFLKQQPNENHFTWHLKKRPKKNERIPRPPVFSCISNASTDRRKHPNWTHSHTQNALLQPKSTQPNGISFFSLSFQQFTPRTLLLECFFFLYFALCVSLVGTCPLT